MFTSANRHIDVGNSGIHVRILFRTRIALLENEISLVRYVRATFGGSGDMYLHYLG